MSEVRVDPETLRAAIRKICKICHKPVPNFRDLDDAGLSAALEALIGPPAKSRKSMLLSLRVDTNTFLRSLPRRSMSAFVEALIDAERQRRQTPAGGS